MELNKVVIVGANGAMGAGSGEVFAAAGISTVFLARTRAKAQTGVARAIKLAKADAVAKHITIGSYDEDLEREVADADLVLEAVAENLELKRTFFARIDAARKPGSIVATVSSGLSIAQMVAGLSDDFGRHFLGMHLFNPPNVIVGCEVVPHAGTDPAVVAAVTELLDGRLGRAVVRTADTPAFAGNRVGFKVLNEVAHLAIEHGVAYMDMLIGPHTGRAMSPLVTVDFVGWDVHKAIVDNLHANTDDEANAVFALPAYMDAMILAGALGNKTPAAGGFYRREGTGADATTFVLDPATGQHRPAGEMVVEAPPLVATMRRLHRVGRYREALDAMAETSGPHAALMRRVVLGYVSYGLGRVGEVVEAAADVDRIMGFGFNWAPPGLLVDLIGAERTVALLERHQLAVPPLVVAAAEHKQLIFSEPNVDTGRFFYAT